MQLTADWYLPYLGKPWAANPRPPESYNCGELARAVYRDLLGIDTAIIPVANAYSRLQCVRAMKPEIFDLLPIPDGDAPQALDVCFLGRRSALSHCGLAAMTAEGLKVLHCPEAACGVSLDSLLELRLAGFPVVRWFRHKDFH